MVQEALDTPGLVGFVAAGGKHAAHGHALRHVPGGALPDH
jgi:hypothetical protein